MLVVKKTTSKNIRDFVVYHKGLSFVGNATRYDLNVVQLCKRERGEAD